MIVMFCRYWHTLVVLRVDCGHGKVLWSVMTGQRLVARGVDCDHGSLLAKTIGTLL